MKFISCSPLLVGGVTFRYALAVVGKSFAGIAVSERLGDVSTAEEGASAIVQRADTPELGMIENLDVGHHCPPISMLLNHNFFGKKKY
jgi:hypothetical protein